MRVEGFKIVATHEEVYDIRYAAETLEMMLRHADEFTREQIQNVHEQSLAVVKMLDDLIQTKLQGEGAP